MCIWLLGVPFCQWILRESAIRFRSSGIPFHLGVAVGPLAFRFISDSIAFADGFWEWHSFKGWSLRLQMHSGSRSLLCNCVKRCGV